MTFFRFRTQSLAFISSIPGISGIPADEIPEVVDMNIPLRKKIRLASHHERYSFLCRISIAARQDKSEISLEA